MQINLISDTVTKPTSGMLEAMQNALVGDDVFGEDPTINALQDKAAVLFGKEAALFCPSGTMTNQIAIKTHTQPLDEMICDHHSHVYRYETGGFAFNSGISVALLEGSFGKITEDQIASAIQPDYDWLPRTSLVVLENTCNKGGGSYYKIDEIRPIKALCDKHGLALHLDGARLFNAIVETGESTQDIGALFHSISICLSKGLGAPVGSLLIGDRAFIKQARRFRKVMGGGMRQAGYLAAAGIYALDHQVDRLKIDNNRARTIASVLEKFNFVKSINPVKTNIVVFYLKDGLLAEPMVARFKKAGINCSAFGPTALRFVFHLDITEEMMRGLVERLQGMDSEV